VLVNRLASASRLSAVSLIVLVACGAHASGLVLGPASASSNAPRVAPNPGSQALSWGSGSYNQLGDDSTASRSVAGAVLDGANTSGTWRSISGGAYHGCGVGGDDSAYCWGYNQYGELGNGEPIVNQSLPVRVFPGPMRWISVEAGDQFSCGVGGDRSAYCWGWNGSGQLGDNSTNPRSSPVAVVGGPSSWNAVSAGGNHACGIGSDDSAYCWGSNGDYQLGYPGGTSAVPILVTGGPDGWKLVSAGSRHTCGIGSDDSAYCWGKNDDGQLGNGTKTGGFVPVRVLGGPMSWISIVAGGNFSCGLGSDYRAYCWGGNNHGRLGKGTVGASADDSVPGLVAAPLPSTVNTVSTGESATHACATSDDSVYCWGYGGGGALGNGSTVDSPLPVPVTIAGGVAGGRPISLGVGYNFTLLVAGYGPPGTPKDVTTVAGDTQAIVSWSAPDFSGQSPITGYTVTSNPGTKTCVWVAGPLTCTVTGLTNGTTYTFSVTASSDAGAGSASNASAPVTPAGSPPPPGPGPGPAPTYPPSAPLSVLAAAGDSEAFVSWTAPSDEGSFPVTAYEVQSSPASGSCLATAPALSCTISGLTNGTAYTFTVRALNGAGWGAISAPSDPATPQASVAASIQVVGTRDTGDRRYARIIGTTTGLVGERVSAWMRFGREKQSRQGLVQPLVASDGTFRWSRKAARSFSVYFAHGAVTSNTVVIERR